MLELVTTSKFRKDLKRLQKRSVDLSKLDTVLKALQKEEPLEERFRDHELKAQRSGLHPPAIS